MLKGPRGNFRKKKDQPVRHKKNLDPELCPVFPKGLERFRSRKTKKRKEDGLREGGENVSTDEDGAPGRVPSSPAH